MSDQLKPCPFYGSIVNEGLEPVYYYSMAGMPPIIWLQDNASRLLLDPFKLPTLESVLATTDIAFSGVYFLFDGDQIVYIGKSIQISFRAIAHKRDLKEFDEVRVLCGIPETMLGHVEMFYINKYRPYLNKQIMRCNEILKPYLEAVL